MRFHRLVVSSAGLLALTLGAGRLQAQTATHAVTFSVVPMSRMGLSKSAASLVVKAAIAGRAPTNASVGGSSYAITTNETNQKITAALDLPMPTGLSLSVMLGAPAGAASAGARTLGSSATDVVTGISAVSASALPITYAMSATSAASSASGTRTVTYTITSGQ